MKKASGAAGSRGDPGLQDRCIAYALFLVHVAGFSLGICAEIYGKGPVNVGGVVLAGIFLIGLYLIFYVMLFGVDEVKWMFTNAALGAVGVYTQLGWLLSQFGVQISAYPLIAHVIPAIFFVLYTFLFRQILIDVTGARNNPQRRIWADSVYLVLSLTFYLRDLYLPGAT